MKKLIGLYFIFLFVSINIFPEDTGNDDLIKKTMQADIVTASYFELKNWAEKLGIDSGGSKKDIEERLFSYYGIEFGDKKISKSSIVISSAKKMESIKIEEIDENYIILTGNIRLEFSDNDNSTKQVLNADRVVFNQKNKTVSATGNIVYTIEKDNSKEYFYGDKLTFNIDSFEGVFFKGISEKHIKENDSESIFYFFGEKIYRKKGDRIVLENGTISSSRKKDPDFHLSASKIWILTPGEWAMKGSVLHVGRIPVFAFPFIYMPGDKLVFHPVFGVRTRDGYFINTTTYLLGQPSSADSQFSSFSFLQNADGGKDTLLKRDGIFLRRTSIPLDSDKDSYLRLISDYYTQKGYFAGLEGEILELGILKNVNIFAGLGINRYIFTDPVYGYTPFYYDSGAYKYLMETPSLFGTELPFRFGFDISSKADLYGVNLSINLPVYSDPDFYSDIMNRKESFDFKNIFSKENNENSTIQSKDTLSWNLTAGWRAASQTLSPIINNLSVDKLKIDVSFLSRDLQYTTVPADPMKFYYPQSIVYPDFSGRITGEIFNTEKKKKKITNADGIGLRSPWSSNSSEGQKEKDKREGILKLPDIDEDEELPFGYKYTGVSQVLSYSIIPKVTLNSILNSTVPYDENQVRTEPDYSLFSLQNITSLNYTMKVSDKLLRLDAKTVLSNNYKDHFAKSDDFTGDWDTFILQDKNYTNYSLTNSISMLSYPFLFSKYFSLSTVKYSINTVVLNHFYNEGELLYNDDYISWSSDNISNHKLSFDLIHKKSDFLKELSLKMVLPPENREIYPSLTMQNETLTSKISTGIKENNYGDWNMDPVSILGKYTFNDSYLSENLFLDIYDKNHISTTEINLEFFDSFIKFKETFKGDVYNFSPISSTTGLNIWKFTSSFVAEKTEGYTFLPNSGWTSNSIEEFQPSKVSFGTAFTYKPDPFWKNRVKLSSDINSSWSMNILKPTDSMFNFNLQFSLDIAEFLELKFKSESVNRAFYRYIPYSADKIGLEETVNPFSDLIKSFNFFNRTDRINSNFNLQLLEIEAVHHLGDWDLNVSYSGKPEIYTKSDYSKEYRWSGSLSVFVEWNPIPEIKKEVVISDDEIQF